MKRWHRTRSETFYQSAFRLRHAGPGPFQRARPGEHHGDLGAGDCHWLVAPRRQGWGAAVGYPGILLDEQGDEVQGWVFTSDSLAEHWARLDAFEGEGYERVVTMAKLGDGTAVGAFIYVLRMEE